MKRVVIYWRNRDPTVRKRIRERFMLPDHVSVNGETEAYIKEQDIPVLEETARRGFIILRRKKL